MTDIAIWQLVDSTLKKVTCCPECGSKRRKRSGRAMSKPREGKMVYIQKLQCVECGRNYREFVNKK